MAIEVPEARLELLRDLPLFEGVGDEELGALGGLLDDIEVEAGEVITTEGETGCESFVIVSGTAEVSVAGRGIATLERGSLFGEMAVLDGKPRAATVRAATPMHLLVAGPDEFAALVAQPEIAVRLLKTLVGRLRDADEAVRAAGRARAALAGAGSRTGAPTLPTEYTLRLSDLERQRYRVMAARAVAAEVEAWARAGIVAGARVADVGCGPGAITVEIAGIVGPHGEVVGVDRQSDALEAAQSEITAAGLTNVRFAAGEATATGLEPGTFDAVMMRHVLVHNGPRVSDIVKHVSTLLRPGGSVFLTEFSATGWHVVPDDSDLAEERERWLDLLRLQGNDLAMGTKLGALVRNAGLELVEFVGRHDIFWLTDFEEPTGGAPRAARSAMIAARLATDDDYVRWDAATARLFAEPHGKYQCVPIFCAIGRRPA